MINPYQMIIMNLIASTVLFLSILCYIFIFPKKKINLLIILFIISLLPLISVLRSGSYESGDLSLHVIQSMEFYKSLSQGILNPIWGQDFNFTYGYPAFMFIYPLPYYLISFFHFFGFTFLNSAKLLIGISFISSGFSMYLFAKEIMNKKAAFISSIFYLFAPYHLVDLHFRTDIGEILIFALLPLNFYFFKKISNNLNLYFIAGIITLYLTILSHPAISLITFLILCIFVIFINFNKENKIKLPYNFLALILGLLISCYYWLPTVYNLRYTHQSLTYSQDIAYVNFHQLIYSPWRFGLLYQGPNGELSFIIGYFHILFSSIGLFLFFKLKIYKNKILLFSIILFYVLTFLTLESSYFFWDNVPLFKNFQFTYRLLLPIAFFSSIISGFILEKIKINKNIKHVILILVILLTILNWGNRKNVPWINDSYLEKKIYSSTYLPQAAPIWTDPNNPWKNNVPKAHLEVIYGKAEIIEVSRSITKHVYKVSVEKDSFLKENTYYFPGWIILVNGKHHEIVLDDLKNQGIISFYLNKGNYIIEIKFNETIVSKKARYISTLSLTIIIFFIIYLLIKRKGKLK